MAKLDAFFKLRTEQGASGLHLASGSPPLLRANGDLPRILLKLPLLPQGLVLVTGPTGSGKSTTLAALINYANTHRRDHITDHRGSGGIRPR